MHKRIGYIIEELSKNTINEVAYSLAHHFYEGKDAKKTLTYAIMAGEKATKAFAPEEAVKYYEIALITLEEIEGNKENMGKKLIVVAKLGEIYNIMGEWDDSIRYHRYALELSELVRANDWQEQGLPPTFDMRIGLHCGPVFCCRDPITKLPLYTGPHTSRTARIEPITPPGQVYASSAFAAVAAATGVDDLKFSYIGRTQLAKKYGSLALYHVQRP